MFDNVGGKCKTLALVGCYLGIIGTILWGFRLIGSGNALNNLSRGSGTNLIISGVAMMILGPLGSWLGSLSLYAIGEAAENSANAAREGRENARILEQLLTKVSATCETSPVSHTTPVKAQPSVQPPVQEAQRPKPSHPTSAREVMMNALLFETDAGLANYLKAKSSKLPEDMKKELEEIVNLPEGLMRSAIRKKLGDT